jgi:hypothetical protein
MHAVVMYYFVLQQEQVLDDIDGSPNQEVSEYSSDWKMLGLLLVSLRVLAAFMSYRLLQHVRALAVGSAVENTWLYFTFLPIVVVALDHLATASLASKGSGISSWTCLNQSILTTYFFIRPLAALSGHDLDVTQGRGNLCISLIATALWLLVPGVPSESRSTHTS